MPFKITIEETTDELKLHGKDWCVIGNTEDGNKKYGYTPEIAKMVDVKRVIYTQIVSELCLVSVINAVNGV